MCADRTTGEDKQSRARAVFEARLKALAVDGGYLPTHLGDALSLGLQELASSEGMVDPTDAETAFPWISWPDDAFVADEAGDLASSLALDEMERLISDVFDDHENVFSWDDSGYAGMTSSGLSGLDLFRVGGRVLAYYWFQDAELGDSYDTWVAYEHDDPDGRRRLFGELAADSYLSWSWGRMDVSLAADFPPDLIPVLRAAAEESDGAPWATGELRRAVENWDDDDVLSRTTSLAQELRTDDDRAAQILRDLWRDPTETPPSPEHRTAAWWVAEEWMT